MRPLTLQPPTFSEEMLSGSWVPLPPDDPVSESLTATHLPELDGDSTWEAARLSQAAYAFRETTTGWAAVAKFYGIKTGPDAERHARRELKFIQLAASSGGLPDRARVVEPLGIQAGVLFLEYVPGLTLEDLIAVRRSRPGHLGPGLRHTAEFLATLHSAVAPELPVDSFEQACKYAHKVIQNLSQYGVLQADPVVTGGLQRLVDRWGANPAMMTFHPALTHGDATTTNFLVPDGTTSLVVIDWERAKVTDPAADIGRLLAEVTHSFTRYGGTIAEADLHLAQLKSAYLPDDPSILSRAPFYQAVSALRIARNGWLPRLERTALVAHAMALLTENLI